jgi:hypothetical protein
MSSQRKQDRWNEKKGQISKSYKLNRSVTEAFTNACAHDNTSQSNKLTSILMDYSINIERRKNIMYIRERYSSGNNYDQLLLTQLEKHLSQLTDSEIDNKFNDFKKEILNRQRFYTFNDAIDYTKDFDCSSELIEYIQKGAPEVIKYISNIIIKQIVLFKLINDGIIMPCQLRSLYSTEININHNHGNSLFEITYNLLPFETFMKI